MVHIIPCRSIECIDLNCFQQLPCVRYFTVPGVCLEGCWRSLLSSIAVILYGWYNADWQVVLIFFFFFSCTGWKCKRRRKKTYTSTTITTTTTIVINKSHGPSTESCAKCCAASSVLYWILGVSDREGHHRVTSIALSADQTRLRLFPLF